MVDLNKLSAPALGAAMRGGTERWGTVGSAAEHVRYAEALPRPHRRKCRCGCERKKTHMGRANGVTLMTGCELSVRRWVRDPLHAARQQQQRAKGE